MTKRDAEDLTGIRYSIYQWRYCSLYRLWDDQIGNLDIPKEFHLYSRFAFEPS
jgi:hypothetical protein